MSKKSTVLSKIIEIYVFGLMAVILFLIIAAFIPLGTDGEANTGSFDASPFNEGWMLEEAGRERPVTLPAKLDGRPGDTLVITNTLPVHVCDGMTLMFRTSIEDIHIYIDGILRESYSSDGFRRMAEHLPSAYVVTALKDADAGRKIRVVITVKDKAVLNEIRLSNGNNAWFKIIRENLIITVIAAIVVILGLLTLFVSLLFRKRIGIGRSVPYLGLLMTDIGLWSLSESRLRQILFARPSLSSVFAYLSMEIAGVLVCMYLDEVQARKYHKAYLCLEGLMSLQMLVNILLSQTGLADLYRTITFSHIWFVLGILVIVYHIIRDIRRKQTADYLFVLTGMGIFILFVILELVNFYLNPFRSFGAFICTGLLFLLVSTLIQETAKLYRLRVDKALSDAASQAKSDFLANMSHEIRTPINAVLGMNELILRESRDPGITEYAANIETAGHALMDIINDVLDLSRIESGHLRIVETDYDPAYMISDACTLIENRAAQKGLSFRVHVDRELPVRLRGDDIRLRQILVNLLTNAVKYTEKGRIILTVNVMGSDDRQVRLDFSVKDTGIGIRPEDCERLFQSFTRLDDPNIRGVEGTGLGLSIVTKLLDMMDSSLRLESVYGAGSDFSFEITQEIVDAAPIGDYPAHIAQRSREKRPDRSFSAPGVRILVIDDRPVNLTVVRGFLKNSGMIIDGAGSGKEGMELMKSNSYDLVFFDHMMPGLDGVETYRKCLEEGILSVGCPAVMMTANAVADAGKAYLDAGFCDYIYKPIDPDELLGILARHLPADRVTFASKEEWVDRSAGLRSCMDDPAVYRAVIEEFLREQDDIALKEAFEAKDWDRYRILVHSVKSGAGTIGAAPLHDLAYACEAALKREDISFVERHHAGLLDLYERTVTDVRDLPV